MTLKERLLNGDVLRIMFAEGVGFDIWAEKYANPPKVFFEGKALPIERLDEVVAKCAAYLEEADIKALWNGTIPAKPEDA
jgi:hypothetical protein